MKCEITPVVEYFNKNYSTNDKFIIKSLNDYIHSRHCLVSLKPDGVYMRFQPSHPNSNVEKYDVYYDNYLGTNHKSGRIQLYFSNGTVTDIGLFKFKRYLREHYRWHGTLSKNEFIEYIKNK